MRARILLLPLILAVTAVGTLPTDLRAADLTQEQAQRILKTLESGADLGSGWTVTSENPHPVYTWLEGEGPAGERASIEVRFDRYSRTGFRTRYFVLRPQDRAKDEEGDEQAPRSERREPSPTERFLAATWLTLMETERRHESAAAAGDPQTEAITGSPGRRGGLPLGPLVTLAAGILVGLEARRRHGRGEQEENR